VSASETFAESAPEQARLKVRSARVVLCTSAFAERWHQLPFSPFVPGS
jgi:hypothetical protein